MDTKQQQLGGSTVGPREVLVDQHMEPPEFTQKIQPCQAIDGDEAQFECRFKGEPRPSISWFCDNRLIRASNLYTIETDAQQQSSRLSIRRVSLAASAIYTVKAENAAGSAKSSANLVVEPHPRPSASRGGHARQVDSSAAAATTSGGGLSGSASNSASQQAAGQVFGDEEDDELRRLCADAVRGAFVSGSDDPLASGRETPESSVSSAAAASSSQHKLIRSVRTRRLSPDQMASRLRASPEGHVPPTFLQTMYDLAARPGELVRLDVRLIGSQPLEVRWLREGERVRPDRGHKLLLEGDLYTLLVLEFQPSDEGHYECCAKNQAGEARCGAQLRVAQQAAAAEAPKQQLAASPASSGLFGAPSPSALQSTTSVKRTVTSTTTTTSSSSQADEAAPRMHFGLTAKPRHQHQLTYTPSDGQPPLEIPLAPKLIKGLESQQVQEGKSVTLRCQISAHPRAEVCWFKQGDKQIKPSKYFRIFKDNDETHCLKILETFAEDQGEYRCVARAQNGSLETSATIQVIPSSPR